MDEFSCPNCRSSLYDPISGCLVCSEKGSKTRHTGVKGDYLSAHSLHSPSEAERERFLAKSRSRAEHKKLVAKLKREAEHEKLLAESRRTKEHGKKVLAKPRRKTERKRLLDESKRIFSEEGLKGLFKGGQSTAYCPFCASSIDLGKMYKHINKAHQNSLSLEDRALLADDSKSLRQAGDVKLNDKTSPTPQKRVAENKEQPSSKTIYYPADQHEHMKESFRQSLYDQRDASSSYAHHFRENGRFGSHPLHDDYDDESFPD